MYRELITLQLVIIENYKNLILIGYTRSPSSDANDKQLNDSIIVSDEQRVPFTTNKRMLTFHNRKEKAREDIFEAFLLSSIK